MANTSAPGVAGGRPGGEPASRVVAANVVRGLIEAGTLALVCIAPWTFGATPPWYEFLLCAGVAALIVLWGLRGLLGARPIVRPCSVSVCLLTLVLVAAWQLVPLPRGLLRRLSPPTAQVYDRLLPAHAEVLPGGEPSQASRPVAGSTLSVAPGATRQELRRLLAILLLFLIVRNNLDPAVSLRRLALAAMINGSFLALFGVIQALSADPHTVFWHDSTEGSPFGPFLNRNHFAFYLNVCTSLGIGLLLSRIADQGQRRSGKYRPASSRHRLATGLMLDPAALGMTLALGLMLGSIPFSLSRGGFLSLLGGLLLGFVLWLPRLRQSLPGEVILLVMAGALGLVGWFGYDQVTARLATLEEGHSLRDMRPAIWARALHLVQDFPIWGTGCGTYEYVDTLHRTGAADADMIVDHAHNDYLELLVEGGVVQFVPGVLALVLVARLGLRAVRRVAGQPVGGLVLGAMMALATVALHSLSDFGLHVPACAAIVTVLCALLCGLGRGDEVVEPVPVTDREPRDRDRIYFRRGWLESVLWAVLSLTVGLVLVCESWSFYRAQRLQGLATDLDQSPDPARAERKIACLSAAVRLTPEDAHLQAALANAHLGVFVQRRDELAESEVDRTGTPPLATGADDLERLKQEHLVPALWHLVRSRDLSPLSAEIHMEIADIVADFSAAEPRGVYLERAKSLAPADPDLWYRCGLYELKDGHPDRAWVSWRRSLELSDVKLPEILDQSVAVLGPRELLRRILPAQPGRLVAAAEHLHLQPGEARRPFLERALAILESQPGPQLASDLHFRAILYRDLDRPAEALAAYRVTLVREPMRLDWRYEHADLAYQSGRYDEARQELYAILALHPDDRQARELMDAVTRKIAAGL